MPDEIAVYDNFQFHGDKLLLVVEGDRRLVSFLKVCDAFRLNAAEQWREVRAREEFDGQTCVRYAVGGQPVRYIAVEAVPLWLFTVSSAALPPELRAKHARYREELVRATYDFTTKGVAIKDGTPLVAVLKEVGEYALRLNPSEKTRIIVSSAIESELARIAGRNAAAELPVTVAARCQERRLNLNQRDVIRLGADVAKAYRSRHGRDPATFDQMIEGAIRKVKSYTQTDLPLIDGVIDAYVKKHKANAA